MPFIGGATQRAHSDILWRPPFVSFELPASVDRNKIAADFSKGVLTLTLPKTPQGQKQAKKIEVKSS